MNRFRLAGIGLFCLALAGCVEGEMTYTVNPDGSAKIRMDVTTTTASALAGQMGQTGGKRMPEDETAAGLLRDSLRQVLENPKVTAWKDVTAELLPNGIFKFSGTAYVRQLSDFARQGSVPLLFPAFKIERTPDGGMKLTRTSNSDASPQPNPNKRKPKTPDEIKKLTDEQLDTEILRELIEVQGTKGMLTAILMDSKLKTTFALPGDVTEATGFTKEGRTASYTIDGNKMLAEINKFLSEDRATLRKSYRASTAHEYLKNRVLGEQGGDGSIVVAKPGEPLFDFEKEVKEARVAYPELRKKFGFGDDVKLPTGETSPKK